MQRNSTLLLLGSLLSPSAAQSVGITLANGVDGYLEVPYSPALVPASGLTVEAWITYDDATIPPGWTWPTIARQNQTPGSESMFFRVQAGQTNNRLLGFKVVTDGGSATATWPFNAGQLATWTHVAGTYDGAFARIFVNGAEVASAGVAGRLVDTGGTLRIGKGDDSGGPIEVWNGEIDEVRLWPFARTAAQIASTMNMSLISVPGKVSTWNLDGNGTDSSGGQHLTPTGTVAFTSNPLNLPLTPAAAFEFGAGTSGCSKSQSVAGVPRVGNASFALVGTGGPSNGRGLAVIGGGALANPFPILGIDLWVNVAAFGLIVVETANTLGTAVLPIAIPPDNGLIGSSLAIQRIWLDACGPQGWAASPGLAFVVTP
jgi:hypothetical protein